MKNEPRSILTVSPSSSRPAQPLQSLVNTMVSNAGNLLTASNSAVINEVEKSIFLADGNEKMLPILNELLRAVISNSRNSQICVSAERFRDLVILEIQDRNNFNGYALGFSVQSIEPEVANAGAYIQFKGLRQRVATISFSFYNDVKGTGKGVN